MTLFHPRREIVREAIGEEVIPDDIVRAVEDDHELGYLAKAYNTLQGAEYVGENPAYPKLTTEVKELAIARAALLIDNAGYGEALDR